MRRTECNTPEFVRQAEEVFFTFMQEGYTNPERKPDVIERFPGDTSMKRFSWRPKEWYSGQTGWRAIDEWTSGEHWSFGNTILYYDSQPVWRMSYEGHYPEHAITLLKKALAHTYKTQEWCGGRGPQEFGGDGMIYQNKWTGSFDAFHSEELIAQKSGLFFEKIGGHLCMGGFL